MRTKLSILFALLIGICIGLEIQPPKSLATIALATGKVFTVTQGGTATETDATASVTSISIDYKRSTLCMGMSYGSLSGSTFTSSSQIPSETGCLNFSNGTMTLNGTFVSTLSGAALTSAQGIIAVGASGLRNEAESFFLNSFNDTNLTGGTFTAWSSVGTSQ